MHGRHCAGETARRLIIALCLRFLTPRSHAIKARGVSTREVRPVPPSFRSHVLRHSCGNKLANDGRDTRSIQHYLGHRSIASTVRYTALAPDRFKDFWKD